MLLTADHSHVLPRNSQHDGYHHRNVASTDAHFRLNCASYLIDDNHQIKFRIRVRITTSGLQPSASTTGTNVLTK